MSRPTLPPLSKPKVIILFHPQPAVRHIPKLPPDFTSYDGTNDYKWNTMYGELIDYRIEHGDCMVNSKKSELGKWVARQRAARVRMDGKRTCLFNKLGFVWECGRSKQIPGGDERQNRAIAAKLVFPDLTVREALRLGGFSEDEMNEIKDPKYAWRTVFVNHKDMVMKKLKDYEKGKQDGEWPSNPGRPRLIQIEKLVNTLQGGKDEHFHQVFGQHSTLLPAFLNAATVRRYNGIVENVTLSGNKKQERMEQSEDNEYDENVDEDTHDYLIEENLSRKSKSKIR